jgi:hypothetical protein
MATLETRLRDLATRIGTESKALRTLLNGNAADLSALTTAAKTNLVAALNELQGEINAIVPGAAIDDASTVANKTWSSTKINDAITTAINVLTTGAPVALNTLDELSAALGDDANFATTITTALGNRVRTNIGADITSTETGNTDADLVAAFNAALV